MIATAQHQRSAIKHDVGTLTIAMDRVIRVRDHGHEMIRQFVIPLKQMSMPCPLANKGFLLDDTEEVLP
jgi:hypothetical protein